MRDTGVSDIDPLEFHYSFKFPNGRVEEFTVRLDETNLGLIVEPPERLPDWTRLDFHQCENCPLKKEEHPRCPVAVSLAAVLPKFSNDSSTQEAEITITTATRTFERKAPLPLGIAALIGLYMVTAGCPIMDRLRPLARTHLPFSTHEETTYRVLSMYLLAQFFIKRKGGAPDWDMKNLKGLMEDVHIVNKTFCDRIAPTAIKDANRNALVLLDCFAGITRFALDKGSMGLIERTFDGYLNDPPAAS